MAMGTLRLRGTHHYRIDGLSEREAVIIGAVCQKAGIAWSHGGASRRGGGWHVVIRRTVLLRDRRYEPLPSDEDLAAAAGEARRIATVGAPLDYDGSPVGGEEEAGR